MAKQYESHFEDHTFVTVLVAKLVRLIPGGLIDILSGLSNVNWVPFFFASLFAELPVDIIYNFAGKELTSNKWISFLIYGIYPLVVLMLAYIYRWRDRTKIR